MKAPVILKHLMYFFVVCVYESPFFMHPQVEDVRMEIAGDAEDGGAGDIGARIVILIFRVRVCRCARAYFCYCT